MSDLAPYQRRIPRERRNARLVFWLLVFFIGLAAVFFFQSPYSRVQQAEVQGNRLLQEREITQRLDLVGQPSILTLRPARMEQTLAKDPVIAEAAVKYRFPNQVTVAIRENRPVALLAEDRKRMILLENGSLFPIIEGKTPDHLPLVQAPLDWEPLSHLSVELTRMPANIADSILLIQPNRQEREANSVTLTMKEGYVVHLSIPKMAQKMAPYPEMVRYLQRQQKKEGLIYLTDEAAWYEDPLKKESEG